MAAGQLPGIGTEYGPCNDEECGHADCASMRTMLAVVCRYCDEPIGTRRMFNETPMDDPVWTVLSHELCVHRRLDREDTERAAAKRARAARGEGQ